MRLEELLSGVEVAGLLGDPAVEITAVVDNSRRVRPGALFVARPGTREDGHRYLRQAVTSGAAAVVRMDRLDPDLPVPQVLVKDSVSSLARILSNFYGAPEKRLRLIGVTGTNGKSSVTWMLREALLRLGRPAGLIGTLLYDTGGRVERAQETTPGLPRLYALLAEMVRSGVSVAVLEVSSHALDQRRVTGLSFEGGVFTNLSRDHLDYHPHLEAYFQAKRRLFGEHLSPEGFAVVNVADPWGRRLAEELSGLRIFRVGEAFQAEILSRDQGLVLRVREPEGEFELQTRLFGDFQQENLLCAWAVLRGLGFSAREAAEALTEAKAPPGRLEPVAEARGARIFVDYAHTPEALAAALKSLRALAPRRLLCLFGCGGNRDRGKRPLMGQVASALADALYLTSDNPRFEDPQTIVREILRGVNGTRVRVILDRRQALREAIAELTAGDILLVAGKGHEDYQEIAGRRLPFSDAEEVKRIVGELS
ncbi:UDP-N-acetylmuramoyl-L-alanyl-D-glutamate--2,6-diaminopimelate ligase [Thermosulfurimonas marina]|uniref:UDP-N-acetylmuramoyl-L-alanyl-D-glutamate--2,6-diaminopimelate ligase n=1 Tax=Thermosulfurimonas marina TaxID=2047767 RepID=A0A6H1WRE1_9BACT|nr:UDP-N-acetylmuramoyl-L-alanyl-D-glutamate--2,6-diaminopimelate ligase [Thermosulfurimonas marina]QJA05762.1 UDP-N-acetylmuramoyl-L-alanyl-D-glutamate--2,6-diaminopimelate ligase [Thermosulfurimonas marina]